uniref:Uncharacterized protein n=1 Tax=CrAss-like virus sp. ctYsL76 TaxID=2826826 RepID=A0A8S5QN67_9CAUD|nr:MAG TPA: hypothetical protein [CrAss-like virus sp. ctYsL76]
MITKYSPFLGSICEPCSLMDFQLEINLYFPCLGK